MSAAPTFDFDLVLLDYGHGFDRPLGAKRYRFTDSPSFEVVEGILNRRVAARLANLLLDRGVEVFDVVRGEWLTRKASPLTILDLVREDVPLGRRASNARAVLAGREGLLVSVHHNAITDALFGPSLATAGAAAFAYPGAARSHEIATSIASTWRKAGLRVLTDRADGDLVFERDFQILRSVPCPAVLVECGFFQNRGEALRSLTDDGASTLAFGVYRGIAPFVRGLGRRVA